MIRSPESGNDLINWLPLGGSVLAIGNTVEFTDTIDMNRRFYRFQRTP